MIRNPILPGFNPDPSICRVGDDYYIATSTFEWYPGVQIHHSRDLVNWTLVTPPARPRDPARHARQSRQLRHLGALPVLCRRPVLAGLHRRQALRRQLQGRAQLHRHRAGDRRRRGPTRSTSIPPASTRRCSTTTTAANGSSTCCGTIAPTASAASPKHPAFAGILLQEYDPARAAARRPGHATSSPASPHGLVEGPHLFKRDGWYYLTTAEGGTGYDHAVTMARSRDDRRPLRAAPATRILITVEGRARRAAAARRPRPDRRDAGRRGLPHASLRPPAAGRRAARRSAARPRIQKCVWGDDGWLRLAHGGAGAGGRGARADRRRRPATARSRSSATSTATALPPDFQWLRTPEPERIFSLTGDRRLRLLRPRIDRQLVRAGAGRAPAGAFRASAPRRALAFAPRHLPAGGRPDALLQPPQVPLPRRHPRRRRSAAC